jgi:hypothetical protein
LKTCKAAIAASLLIEDTKALPVVEEEEKIDHVLISNIISEADTEMEPEKEV